MSDRIESVEAACGMFDREEEFPLLPLEPRGAKRAACESVIERDHYTHSIPSGKSHWFYYRGAIVVFSIPANQHLGRFVLKRPCVCWELSRLWAKDGHKPNLLTEAISQAVRGMREVEPDTDVLVSFADPNVGHEGTIYRAASWVYTGTSEDPRGYVNEAGEFFPRRAFHSGDKGMTRSQIEAKGFRQVFRKGKHRFIHAVNRRARADVRRIWQ